MSHNMSARSAIASIAIFTAALSHAQTPQPRKPAVSSLIPATPDSSGAAPVLVRPVEVPPQKREAVSRMLPPTGASSLIPVAPPATPVPPKPTPEPVKPSPAAPEKMTPPVPVKPQPTPKPEPTPKPTPVPPKPTPEPVKPAPAVPEKMTPPVPVKPQPTPTPEPVKPLVLPSVVRPEPLPPTITEPPVPATKPEPIAPPATDERMPTTPGFRTSPSNIIKPVPILPPQSAPPPAPEPVDPPLTISSDVEQIAPPAPMLQDKLPYGATLGSDVDSQELAAEVAAILSKEQPILARAPRPLIMKLPSERYLAESTAKLDTLPMDERPSAFQAIIEKYRAMRTAEREKMSRR